MDADDRHRGDLVAKKYGVSRGGGRTRTRCTVAERRRRRSAAGSSTPRSSRWSGDGRQGQATGELGVRRLHGDQGRVQRRRPTSRRSRSSHPCAPTPTLAATVTAATRRAGGRRVACVLMRRGTRWSRRRSKPLGAFKGFAVGGCGRRRWGSAPTVAVPRRSSATAGGRRHRPRELGGVRRRAAPLRRRPRHRPREAQRQRRAPSRGGQGFGMTGSRQVGGRAAGGAAARREDVVVTSASAMDGAGLRS